VDDGVEHAVFQQELAALETLWQLLADCLLDDAGPAKPMRVRVRRCFKSPSMAKDA